MIFHKHKWDRVSENIIPSAAKDSNLTPGEVHNLSLYSGIDIHPEDYYKTIIVIVFTCSECGKIKTIVESNI